MIAYTLEQFVKDLDAITARESDPAAITAKAAPLLARLCQNPDALPARYRTAPSGQRGRYILHRAPRFNVTAVVWRPGDEAASHDHETWGLVGVVENEIQETRYTSSGRRDLGGRVTLEVKEVLRHKPGAVSALVTQAQAETRPDIQASEFWASKRISERLSNTTRTGWTSLMRSNINFVVSLSSSSEG